jgi:hypothetical protein
MTRFALVVFALALAGTPSSGQSQKLAGGAPEEIESALRARVETFYTHFQKSEFRQAEKFIEEESRDAFYGAKKNRILGFEVKTIKWAEDFRSANVLVSCHTIVPMLGSAPVAVPLAGDWRYQDGDWFMHLDAREEVEVSEDTTTSAPSPFGPMQFNQNVAAPGGFRPPTETPRPTVESLREMYQVSTQMLRFPPNSDEPVTRSIKVKNNSLGKMQLQRYTRDIPGIEVSVPNPEFQAGEETTIDITYTPETGQLSGRYRIDFMLMPISQMFEVFLDF